MVQAREILRRRAHEPETNRMAKATNHCPHRKTHTPRPRQKTRLQSQTRLRNSPHPREKRWHAKAETAIGTQTKTHGSRQIQTRQKYKAHSRRTHSQKIPKPRSPKQLLGRRRRTPQMVRNNPRRPKPPCDKNRQRRKLDNREAALPPRFPQPNKCRQKSSKFTQER